MNLRRPIPFPFATLVLFALALLSAPGRAVPLPTIEEVATTASWFNSLEWPDIRGKPYIEYNYGQWKQGPKSQPTLSLRGFLLEEDDKALTIFPDGTSAQGGANSGWALVVQQLSKEKQAFADLEPNTHRILDLPTAVNELLTELHRPKDPDERRGWFLGRVVSERTAIFIFARCCEKQGRADLAAQLDAEVCKLIGLNYDPDLHDREGFRVATEKEIAHAFMWSAVLDYGNMTKTRPQLLAQFERIVRDFPASEHCPRAEAHAGMVRRMIEEDRAHAESAKPLAAMTDEEKIQEWIFLLRDQNGQQFSQPGSCDIFADFGRPGAGKSPAHDLARMGHAAVPALIAALNDPRLSRSVGYGRSHFFSHHVLTIGDCALQVISRIAGRHTWTDVFARNTSPEERLKETHAAVKAWWRDVQEKGDKEMLREGVRSGGFDSYEQARRLALLDPAAAVDDISAGMAAAKPRTMGPSMLMGLLTTIKSEAATAALRREMRACTDLESRVIAASELFRRGEKDTIPAMIAEWNRWKAPRREETTDHFDRIEPVIVFLGKCGDLEARKALAARFPTVPVGEKFHIITAMMGTDSLTGEKPFPSAEAEAAGEELVFRGLDDPSSNYRSFGTRGELTLSQARVCDWAADAFAVRWPERYAFPWPITRQERDAAIAKVRNTWREAHGLGALPSPSPEPAKPDTATAAGADGAAIVHWKNGRALAELPLGTGRPATAQAFVAAIIQLHRDLPKDCLGFDFYAERAGAGRSFRVEIEWWPGTAANRRASWGYRNGIGLDGDMLRESGGGASAEHCLDEKGYDDVRRALTKALAAEGPQAITVYFTSHLNDQ